jgi:hypothetical protein|tara:strand:+ start:395 stop:721 length:327 start_codon:yes stop_codon:yes gene_type:complete
MKTFQQFIKETPKPDNVPSIIKSLKGLATDIGTNNPDLPKQIKNTVMKTVAKKFAPTIQKGAQKMDQNLNKMATDLPGAMNKFQDFLDSGKIQKGFNKMSSQMSKVGK